MDKVTEYIKRQGSPQKEICQKLRKIILKSFPGIAEQMKMGVPWYEDRFYIVALKDHVNLGLCIKGMGKKDLDRLEGAGKSMRHLKFFSLKDVSEKGVVSILKAVG